MLTEGAEVVLTGKLATHGRRLTFQSPTFEPARRELLHAGRIVPIYPEHTILKSRWMREKMVLLKDAIALLPETLPRELVEGSSPSGAISQEDNVMPRAEAIRELHFPTSGAMLQRARERLEFEELYNLQLKALQRRREWQARRQQRLATPMNIELIRQFFHSLNFTPTDSQRIAIYEILRDLEKPVPMSRLLEGDVGSGKTLVAIAVMANVTTAGGQCALMVPTEVLAKQHAENVTRMLMNFWKYLRSTQSFVQRAVSGKQQPAYSSQLPAYSSPAIALLTGSTPPAEAVRIKQGLMNGMIQIVIGTHALIQEDVHFRDIRLAIVDEQHRFGVEQRKALGTKGTPHFLAMTATPIPRTLALTAYGDHDLSVLLEKPGNRKPIVTKVAPPRDRRTVELFIDREIDAGRQGYVICPLIQESEELAEVRSVEAETERLREAFPRRRIAALHGQLLPKEKDKIMQQFKERRMDILVSTSVIEVGIDVPNASIILIEGAERFGLAQLHQLRGRVGRGDHQSYCFLCATDQTQADSERLRAMEQSTDGFRLAEIDLKLRGPGELYGTRQSGLPEIRIGALTNPALVVRARRAAERMLREKRGQVPFLKC
jgi:ATP-dependent DNA helicase RecG